ncbi:MAG: hypothetical protein A3G33_03255 [Omnitrophica bacterium RIFCSPLOWO2_12_FULL_44_17]|uniref:Glycosyltransferase RgtA/B/C/D-like domain-containing protein n=1 Tax=Candidatus Danuiimicrobium aquiferis TaxID=1801832 RepID=A0A1G1KTV5_9BACT|nr:MAG: hypothetical protein A3B72_06800 [Omnitrophica bacterium RIFCSPHIGHO2_02_FULL_45_28]OGW88539.1 MAG: hypothetical protein A3E74_02055 [Omnitrophica bacterium RIFCSPHIGHO2_12_FULL_44_12]OGW96337.1 MAG: hypothetical protein A3G33_03255 [Omnitrophica bacterium RIFCSPLOWO2_12_FULL_44_17]OGX04854.1 MAG: hypothetical protein A3J12_07875 [Omnitrophica bacterium RIFCSPLOWO2_02_FULL_44_11]
MNQIPDECRKRMWLFGGVLTIGIGLLLYPMLGHQTIKAMFEHGTFDRIFAGYPVTWWLEKADKRFQQIFGVFVVGMFFLIIKWSSCTGNKKTFLFLLALFILGISFLYLQFDVIRFTAFTVSVFSIHLLCTAFREKESSSLNSKRVLFLIIALGTLIRFFLAYATDGNFDMGGFIFIADVAHKGGNIYLETHRYNYSCAWFLISGFLSNIQNSFPTLGYPLIHRVFLSCVDLATLWLLMEIARIKGLSRPKTAIFFYLNPVSFLLTGFHGQFENLALLMIILGIYCYLRLENKPLMKKGLLWLFSTIGMIVKHNIFYATLICANFLAKRHIIRFVLFTISVALFLLTFLPYWSVAHKAIIDNVFHYGGITDVYGITSFLHIPGAKYLFIIGLFLYCLLLKNKDILKQCLLGSLFFLTFTTGYGIQYFVLPIAFASLRPSKGFLLYTIVATIFIMAGHANVNIYFFRSFNQWNLMWLAVLYWFLTEHFEITIRKRSE